MSSYSPSPIHEAADGHNAWLPGAVRRLPWKSLIALLGCVAGLAGSAAVLVYSDGEAIASWKYQPATYLAIATVITNLCLFYIIKEGATIAWWTRASRSGTVVGDLHRYWNFGTSFQDALLAGRHFNYIALACILATAAQINSPLLQRASRAVVEPLPSTTSLTLKLAQTLPLGYTGLKSGRQYALSLYTQAFGQTVQAFNNNGSIAMTETGCQGRCSTSVKGIGLALNCSSYTVPFDLNPSSPDGGAYNVSADPAVINGTFAFESNFRWSARAASNISLDVSYKSTNECDGVLHVTNCTIHPAVVTYKVFIDNNASTIALDPSTTIFDDVVEDVLSFNDSDTQGPSTLGGYWLALSNKFDSTAHLRWAGAVGYELLTTGNSATQYVVPNETTPDGKPLTGYQLGTSCNLYFSNPTNDLLAAARNLMFRTSIAAANSTTPVQTVQATQTLQHAVFRTNYAYMAAALAITILAILLALGLFKDYWQLGRKTSMSPIEIAKAFNAPLLRGSDSNASAADLIEHVGERSVRYGAVTGSGAVTGNDGMQEGEGFDEAEHRERKKAFSSSTDLGLERPICTARLEMVREDRMTVPKMGMGFGG